MAAYDEALRAADAMQEVASVLLVEAGRPVMAQHAEEVDKARGHVEVVLEQLDRELGTLYRKHRPRAATSVAAA